MKETPGKVREKKPSQASPSSAPAFASRFNYSSRSIPSVICTITNLQAWHTALSIGSCNFCENFKIIFLALLNFLKRTLPRENGAKAGAEGGAAWDGFFSRDLPGVSFVLRSAVCRGPLQPPSQSPFPWQGAILTVASLLTQHRSIGVPKFDIFILGFGGGGGSMACGFRYNPSPSHLGAAGNYASLKGLEPCTLPSASATSSFPASVVKVVCKKRERGEWGERESFAPYYVTVVTPPPRNLGIHSLPPNTQCGETVEVKGEPYVVSGVTYRYQLRRGKYEPSEKRLDVQSLGRYFVNLYYENLLEKL